MDIGEMAFLMLGVNTEDGKDDIVNVFGTCFCLAENYFVTCCHVIEQMDHCSNVAIGKVSTNRPLTYDYIEKVEKHAAIDVAIFTVPNFYPKPLVWDTSELSMLVNVQSYGFPFALDKINKSISIR